MKATFLSMNRRSTLFPILGVVCALSFVSCDKAKQYLETAQEKLKEIKNSDSKEGEALVKEVVAVNETDGKAIIMSERRLVVVEFYSDTWAPCRKIAPVLGRLAEKNSEIVRIIKVDATKNQKWATSENVRGIPAFRLYNGGMLVDQFAGAYPENILQGKIDKYSTLKFSEPQVTPGEEGKDAPPKEPTVRPMPTDWLPPGVTSG